MTAIQRQGKLLEKRTIYVSWLVEDATSQTWVEEFWLKIGMYTPPHPPKLRRTEKALPGDHVNVDIDELLADVTDIVAVVTGRYLKANKEGQRPTDREFARYLELMEQDIGDSGSRRAWLAMLERYKPEWLVIGKVTLQHCWLLKDPRFALPPNDDEIADAVEKLIEPESED